MSTNWIEKVTGDFAGKKEWREFKSRMKALPENYYQAYNALEHYTFNCGGMDDAGLSALQDLGDLLEQSARDGLSLNEVLGDDPAEFMESFFENYPRGKWIIREKERLNSAIAANN